MQQLLKIFIVARAQSSTRQCIRAYIFHHEKREKETERKFTQVA